MVIDTLIHAKNKENFQPFISFLKRFYFLFKTTIMALVILAW